MQGGEELTLDLEAGRAARDAALERVGDAAQGDPWLAWARGALRRLAAAGPPFNADDLEALRVEEGAPEPRSRMAVGTLFSNAARAEVIVRAGESRQMAGPRAHARSTSLWIGAQHSTHSLERRLLYRAIGTLEGIADGADGDPRGIARAVVDDLRAALDRR